MNRICSILAFLSLIIVAASSCSCPNFSKHDRLAKSNITFTGFRTDRFDNCPGGPCGHPWVEKKGTITYDFYIADIIHGKYLKRGFTTVQTNASQYQCGVRLARNTSYTLPLSTTSKIEGLNGEKVWEIGLCDGIF